MASVHEDPRPYCELNVLEAEPLSETNCVNDEDEEFFHEPFEVALDSGSGEHVVDEGDVPAYKVSESMGSRAGQHFVAANNSRIPNRGQVTLNLRGDTPPGQKGREIRSTFQVAKVSRPLWSVGRICDEGFDVKFTKHAALIMNGDGRVVCRFERRGGLYIAKMSLGNPLFKMGFQRQGPKA